MLDRVVLFARLFAYTATVIWDHYQRSKPASKRFKSLPPLPPPAPESIQNIVIVGASFAGYHCARTLARSLPPNSPYRIVVIEPRSHFHFTWVLPRFCVVQGHEHKAFIPYGPYLEGGSEGIEVRWVKDAVVSVGKGVVQLRDSEEEIGYAYLVIATGSGAADQLPSRVGTDDKAEGLIRLRAVQEKIKDAQKIVVVGGGAAGVELATDAKGQYKEKKIVLVHSRQAVMHRFRSEFQKAALDGLKKLGVEVILGERVINEEVDEGFVTLKSGRKVECDYVVRIHLFHFLDCLAWVVSNICLGQLYRPKAKLEPNRRAQPWTHLR